MASNSPHEAVRNFAGPINRALSCVTQSIVVGSGHDPAQERHAVALNKGSPVRLRGNTPFFFMAMIHYKVIKTRGELGPWRVSTVAYVYSVLDKAQIELLAYHWHPRSTPQHPEPHLHIYRLAPSLHLKLHLPTRRISLEEFLRFLITELKVKPLRSDSEKILNETQVAGPGG